MFKIWELGFNNDLQFNLFFGHITLLGIANESHEPFLWCFLVHFGPYGFRRTRGWVNDDRVVIMLCPSMRKVPFDSIEVSTCHFLSCYSTFYVSPLTHRCLLQTYRLSVRFLLDWFCRYCSSFFLLHVSSSS